MNDARGDIYNDLHAGQLKAQEQENRQSADCILDILWQYLQPKSALDVGCGLGTWLAALQGRGVKDLRGIDGPWLKPADAVCDPALLQVCDLESKFALGRTFDLPSVWKLPSICRRRRPNGLSRAWSAMLRRSCFRRRSPSRAGTTTSTSNSSPIWRRILQSTIFCPSTSFGPDLE
ncbi:MAG: class I SAM-dependent methyltransferase [Xanthobacteraceae bacterium]|nr:class I SAM-dependent methyltransferase [Xanthobacteraceae bacterium]